MPTAVTAWDCKRGSMDTVRESTLKQSESRLWERNQTVSVACRSDAGPTGYIPSHDCLKQENDESMVCFCLFFFLLALICLVFITLFFISFTLFALCALVQILGLNGK